MKFKELRQVLEPHMSVDLRRYDDSEKQETILYKEDVSRLDSDWFIPGYFDNYTVTDLIVDSDEEPYLVIILEQKNVIDIEDGT